MLKYLMDENVNPLYAKQLRRRQPTLTILSVGEPGTPPQGTPDPDILAWCEQHDFVLVTNNRASMPQHLSEHIAQNRHTRGILTLNPNLSIGETIDELVLITQTIDADELQDVIAYLPL